MPRPVTGTSFPLIILLIILSLDYLTTMKAGLIYLIAIPVFTACSHTDTYESTVGQTQISYSPPVTVLLSSRDPAKTTLLPSNAHPHLVKVRPASKVIKHAKSTVAPPVTTLAAQPISSFTHFGTEQGLALSNVACGWVDSLGNLWFGTAGGGVSRFDGTNFTTFTTRHGLGHNTVRSIVEDKAGNIWFGTNGGGVSRFNGASFTTFTTEHGLAHNKIRAMTEDTNGNLWIGTEGGGVSRYDGNTFTTFSTKQGLAHTTVWCITEDKGRKYLVGNRCRCKSLSMERNS